MLWVVAREATRKPNEVFEVFCPQIRVLELGQALVRRQAHFPLHFTLFGTAGTAEQFKLELDLVEFDAQSLTHVFLGLYQNYLGRVGRKVKGSNAFPVVVQIDILLYESAERYNNPDEFQGLATAAFLADLHMLFLHNFGNLYMERRCLEEWHGNVTIICLAIETKLRFLY